MCHIPTSEALLLLQKLEHRVSILTVHLHFLESWELGAVGQLAELVNRLICARSLLSKLVAREIENLETLTMIFLV